MPKQIDALHRWNATIIYAVPRGRLGIVPRKCFIYKALAHNREDSRQQMAIYISGLVMEIRPAFEAHLGVVHDGAVAMADAIVVLIPRRHLIITTGGRDGSDSWS